MIKVSSMSQRILFRCLLFLIPASAFYSALLVEVRVAPFTDTKTLILYDASSGAIPGSLLLAFTDFPPGSASLTYTDGATILDTTSSKDTFAGWVANPTTTAGFPILDRTTGVQVNFTMQVESETHRNENRAGFSMIILDQEAKGIEIAFWENQVWTQSDESTGGLFRHGERAAFATTNITQYQVTIVGETYTISANSMPLLSGPVRDYSSFSGFPDPYETPNFLFMGDDTTSSQSRVKLLFVSITGTAPVVPTVALTSSGTAMPVDTPSSAPIPSLTTTPFPTPIAARPGIELCPSGWLVGVMLFGTISLAKRTRSRTKHF